MNKYDFTAFTYFKGLIPSKQTGKVVVCNVKQNWFGWLKLKVRGPFMYSVKVSVSENQTSKQELLPYYTT